MAVVSNLSDISLCESLTNWSSSGGPTLGLKSIAADDLYPVEGTYFLGGDLDVETGIFLYDEYAANGNVAQDYSGRHYHAWVVSYTPNFLDIQANGGIRLVMEDGSGNQGFWNVAGSDTYVGGWAKHIIDCDSTPTSNNGANPVMTNIYRVGVSLKGVIKSKLGENFGIDLVQWGSSTEAVLTVTGGTDVSPLGLADILSADQALAKPTGVIERVAGSYVLQAGLEFNDPAGTADLYFKELNNNITWKNTLAAESYYKITIAGNATGVTSFIMGAMSGTGDDRFGSGGGSIAPDGLHAWSFDAETYAANNDEVSLYGVTMLDSGRLQFDTVAQSLISCTLSNSAMLEYNEALVLNSYFLNSVDANGAVEMLDNGDDNLRYCVFRQCDNGVYFPSGQTATRDFVGLDFDDVTLKFDVNNASGLAVTVNNTAGSNANSYTGSEVSFPATATLTVIVTDAATDIFAEDARVHVVADAGGTMTEGDIIIDAEITGVDGTVTGTINTINQPYKGLVVDAEEPNLYIPFPFKGIIPAAGATVNIGLSYDA